MPNKWAPLRRLRDWEGKLVKTKREIRNAGGGVIPSGRSCVVTNTSRSLLEITWYSGVAHERPVSVSRVSLASVTLIGKEAP